MRKLKTFEIEHLVNYTVNRIITADVENFKEFRKVEKAAITARLNTIAAHNKKNPNQREVLEVIYKELGVSI